jgi:hypothetical protein
VALEQESCGQLQHIITPGSCCCSVESGSTVDCTPEYHQHQHSWLTRSLHLCIEACCCVSPAAGTVARQACRTSTLQRMSDAAASACSRPARRTLKSTSRPADWRYVPREVLQLGVAMTRTARHGTLQNAADVRQARNGRPGTLTGLWGRCARAGYMVLTSNESKSGRQQPVAVACKLLQQSPRSSSAHTHMSIGRHSAS